LVQEYLAGPGNALTAAEATDLADYLTNDVGDEDASTGDGVDTAAVAAEVQSYRYLEVTNDTGRKLTVYLQYKTPAGEGFVWQPADPKKSNEALAFELKPGETVCSLDGDSAIAACRVRIWAESADGTVWWDYRDADLWLVPETDSEGYHSYRAAEAETFTFTFDR
jgi:hypothetical protein